MPARRYTATHPVRISTAFVWIVFKLDSPAPSPQQSSIHPNGRMRQSTAILYNFSVNLVYVSNSCKQLIFRFSANASAFWQSASIFGLQFQSIFTLTSDFWAGLSRYTSAMRIDPLRRVAACTLIVLLFTPVSSFAWGNEGHRLVNKLAGSNLPAEVPAFLRSEAAITEIEYLGPEPDRWRSRAEPELAAAQAPEHFIDLEPADALGPLPRNRLDFEASIFAHGQRPEKVGLQPWETLEIWQRLKADLREYRRLVADKSANPGDLHAAEQAAIFYAGWLGHYVGDGSQPLHTTINYDGWALK